MGISGKELVERIDTLLKEKGYKGREILYNGITKKATISNWVAGKAPSAYTLYEVARFLGVSLDFLLTGKSPIPGLSPEAIEIARAADRLSPEGRIAALKVVRGMESEYPFVDSGLSSEAK
jgi:transcriptional regulator with XRE-family HTH domain